MVIYSELDSGWAFYKCPNGVTIESKVIQKLSCVEYLLFNNKNEKIVEYIRPRFFSLKSPSLKFLFKGFELEVKNHISLRFLNKYVRFNIMSDIYHIIIQNGHQRSIHKNGKQIGVISFIDIIYSNRRLIEFDSNIDFNLIATLDFIALIDFFEFFESNVIYFPFKAKAIYPKEKNWEPNQN